MSTMLDRVRGRGRQSWAWLCVPAAIFVAVVYLVPIGLLVARSLTDGPGWFDAYARVLGNAGYVATIGRTVVIAAVAAVVCLLIGYPLAWVVATARPAVKRLLLVAVVAPYLTSVLVRSFAWQVLLGRIGPVNRFLEVIGIGAQDLIFTALATIIGLVHFLLPLMVLALVSVMSQVDPSLRRAARSMGAGRARSFVRIVMPATLPGVETGVILTFVYGVGAFVTPAILGGQSGTMIGVLIQSAVETRADYGLAAASAMVLALVVLAVVAFFRFRMSGNLEWLVAPDRISSTDVETTRTTRIGRGFAATLDIVATRLDDLGLSRHRWVLTAYAFVVALFLLVPQLVTAIPISLSSTRTLIVPPPGWSTQWYGNFLSAEWFEPFTTSLQVAVVVCLLATTLAGLAAVAVVRSLGGRAAVAVTLLMLGPLVIPRVVAGAAMYTSFLPIDLVDTRFGIILAHTCLTIPFAFAVVSAATRGLDPMYERAAASLGATRMTQLRRVTIPLLKPAFLTAMFLTFLTSFDEAVVAIFLSGLDVKTLPRRMFEALTLESDPTIGVVAVVLMVVSGLVVGATGLTRAVRRDTSPDPAEALE